MNKFITILVMVVSIIMYGCQKADNPPTPDMTIVAETDSIAILYQVVDSAKNEYDIPEVAIWIKNKTTEQVTKLYQTIRPDRYSWYMPDRNKFYPVPIDSILVTSRVSIYNEDPLMLIVEGCPDMRNEFSYFIDVSAKKAWYIPANQGYVGVTSEEGYMIFQSFRHARIGGRYTFLKLFDYTGNMVDSLDLEHLHLE